jgi:hypothetical protein
MARGLPGLTAVTTTGSGAVFLDEFTNLGFLRCFPNSSNPRFYLKKQLSHQLGWFAITTRNLLTIKNPSQ